MGSLRPVFCRSFKAVRRGILVLLLSTLLSCTNTGRKRCEGPGDPGPVCTGSRRIGELRLGR